MASSCQAVLPTVWPAQKRLRQGVWVRLLAKTCVGCEGPKPPSVYYGSYSGDRFGGGIGVRFGVSEQRKLPLPRTGVARVALFSDTHENLREWATEANWNKATEIHKAAYFTRTENQTQEAVLQCIREHYVKNSYVARVPVQAGLFRLEDKQEFEELCGTVAVKHIPGVAFGPFNEKSERYVVDFANKRLGGGWLSYGMAQEEKMFIERFDYGALCAKSLLEMPDPLASPIASPFSMHPDEAWILRGAPMFAHVPWYGRTPADGLHRVKLLDPADDRDTAPTVIAIDAIKANFVTYEPHHLDMMLAKAYTGFVAASKDADMGGAVQISTGSWGCGVFCNNERVMFVIQALAANLANVDLVHHVLGDGYTLAPALAFLEEALRKKWTVGKTLDELARKCAEEEGWRSKFKPKEAK